MSYNILNKGVKFQGATKGTIEDLVDTHSTQTVNGLKTVTFLTGTHVRVTNDATVLGNLSASVNISASAFYGDGSNLTGVDKVITALNGATSAANSKITTANGTELDAEGSLTFNSTTKELVVGSVLSAVATGSFYGKLSASLEISASAFYGSGAGLTGIPGGSISLKANGGIADSSGLALDSGAGAPAGGLDKTNDKFLIFDANASNAVKTVSAANILAHGEVTTYNGQTEHRVLTSGGSNVIDGEAALTFDGSKLTITGEVSGSSIISGSIGHFVTKIEAAAIDLDDASGIAGLGLGNSLGGLLSVETSGALKIASDKVSITGSIAGSGLEYGGGVNSINLLAVKLDSNSGLAVSTSGIKTNFAGLASATPAVAADNLTFIDSDGDKKCSFSTFLTAIAGANLGVSGSQLTASAGGALSAVANGSNNRIATFSSADALNGEANLTFDSNNLALTGSILTKDSSNTAKIFESSVANSGSVVALRYKEVAHTCGTDNDNDEIAGFFEANMIPVAVGIRVTSAIGNNAYISKLGTINDDDSFGTFANGDLEESGDNLVTSYHPANATGQNTKWFTAAHELKITYNATPSSGALRFGLYYYDITPPTS